MDCLDLVGRTAELARTFGIDFFSVLSRGSQVGREGALRMLLPVCLAAFAGWCSSAAYTRVA